MSQMVQLSLWDAVPKKLTSNNKLLLLLDYDGTLTPIRSIPEKAVLSKTMRSVLKKLASHPRIIMAIISGRSLQDIQNKVRIGKIIYAGNHGLELAGCGLRFTHPKARKTKPLMRQLARIAKKELVGTRGVSVENKKLTLSIHYRRVKKSLRSPVQKEVKKTIEPYLKNKRIKLTRGKYVLEIRPNTMWGKGTLAEWLLKRLDTKQKINRAIPIYIGDDKTDEEAFQTINRKDGISIVVGRTYPKSKARYRLKTPKEALTFLKKLNNLLKNTLKSVHHGRK